MIKSIAFIKMAVVSLFATALFFAIAGAAIAQNAPTKEELQNADVYFDKALALRRRGKLKEAIEAYLEGLRLNPKSAYHYHQLGYTHS